MRSSPSSSLFYFLSPFPHHFFFSTSQRMFLHCYLFVCFSYHSGFLLFFLLPHFLFISLLVFFLSLIFLFFWLTTLFYPYCFLFFFLPFFSHPLFYSILFILHLCFSILFDIQFFIIFFSLIYQEILIIEYKFTSRLSTHSFT